jgi:hypothetical protein
VASNLEQRIYRLEAEIRTIQQQLAGILSQLAALAQQIYAQQAPGGGGGGGGGTYFACTLSAALAHASSVSGQTVWKLVTGTRTNVTTTAVIYNDGPNAADDIASGKTVILATNDDGSYTVIGVYC